MIASELISSSLYPAKLSDPVYRIQDMLISYRLLQLPVVDEDNKLITIVDEDFLGTLDDDALIGDHVTNKGMLIHIAPQDHIFDIVRLFGEQKKTMLPVLDDHGFCLGIISQEDVFLALANSYSFREQGSIIVLESLRTAYAMSEISQILESEQATLISCFLSDGRENNTITITLKINKMDIYGMVSTFERFGYTVKASYTQHEYQDTIKQRYDLLMNYLNV